MKTSATVSQPSVDLRVLRVIIAVRRFTLQTVMPGRSREESGHGDRRPPEAWLGAVMREERRGELLAAYDLAERALAEHPHDVPLKHRAVLALARAGATDQAARRFADYGLTDVEDEDVAALRARIEKDAALAASGDRRRVRAARAAELYADVFARTGGYYPAINAATLWLLAGDAASSRRLAKRVIHLLDANGEASYYAVATEAEAQLLLGRTAEAQRALGLAAERHRGDYGALATTRRQLRIICETLGLDSSLLSPLAGPGVAFFCGHMITPAGQPGRFPADAEPAAAAAIARALDQEAPGYAYGGLAGGADIMWAEALLTRGSELHVVLPFAMPRFVEQSVARCGPGWVQRFHRCLEAATDVRYGTDDTLRADDVLFRYGSELAMGLTLLRGRYLDANVRQLALWDSEPAMGTAGTAIDVATWRSAGRPATIVTPQGEVTMAEGDAGDLHQHGPAPSGGVRSSRVVRAMLFGDFARFSELSDEQAVTFATRVLGAVAEVLQRYGDRVRWRNTWGDGLNVMLIDAAAAAACALDLQDAVAEVDLASEGLPRHLALRLGGHLGPVFPVHDPVLDADAFTGTHVSRTARIEPVTPPGEVYVTEAFAAALELAGHSELTCDYVGHMAAAKGYGRLRMYRLHRVSAGDDPVR
jgi:tetratricopeptide (TPR) repeat protein